MNDREDEFKPKNNYIKIITITLIVIFLLAFTARVFIDKRFPKEQPAPPSNEEVVEAMGEAIQGISDIMGIIEEHTNSEAVEDSYE